MCSFWMHQGRRAGLGTLVAMLAFSSPICALDKPTGAPLVLSSIETEQAIPLAIVDPEGKNVNCVMVRLHWNPNLNVGPDDDSTSFTLDIKPESLGASIFAAQLWKASLASAMAWQQPWQGARWKILDTPATDGTGINAALAVGMISTAARRLYPKDTLVIGSLNPDGSLGAVSRLTDRVDAAAAAGIKRIIIPNVQRFDTDSSGQVLNIVRHANDLHLDCVPVDNLVEATETAMNDPLPEATLDATAPRYSDDVASYIDSYAHREQLELSNALQFAPKESDLGNYPLRLAAIWRKVYADSDAGDQAYRAGQVYVAYRLFVEGNGLMHGINALAEQNRGGFDVKGALAESDELRQQLHALMNPPTIDRGELESAVLVAEMADWAYDIDASLEGAQLVTKQTFSQRTDATEAQRDRAHDEILFVIEQAKYLLNGADFYQGLIDHIGNNSPMPVDENAAHLLPQLIPAQLATAQLFTDGIRPRANEMRDGLLFDPRLVAYVNVLRETKAAWDARLRKKELEATEAPPTPETPPSTNTVASPAPPAASTNAAPDTNVVVNATKPNAPKASVSVMFDPGNTYAPPHTILAPTTPEKKLSDVAACLIWVNNDCEIATLDEKYLRLSGTVDPVSHEWHVKDRAKLDALLQAAELGARHGIAFAGKVEVDPSVLAMIYEKASHARVEGDDDAALDALRNYWRCALLGNLCWQLAHTHKAEAVDLGPVATNDGKGKPGDKTTAKTDDKGKPSLPAPATTNEVETPKPPTVPVKEPEIPVAPIATNFNTEPSPPITVINTTNIPVAPVVSHTEVEPGPPKPVAPTTEVHAMASGTNVVVAPNPPPPEINPNDIPVAPIATNLIDVPAVPLRALPLIDNSVTNAPPAPPTPPAPPVAPVALPVTSADTNGEPNIPVAPIAKPEDYTGGDMAPTTNAAPVVGPAPPVPNP